MNRLFVDMDGVLADFDTGYELSFGIRPSKKDDNVDWKLIDNTPRFYENLPPMPDLDILWNWVSGYDPHPIVLTGVPLSVKEAPDNKIAWVRKHLGSHVEVRCCPSKDKCLHCSPGDILIDDWEKHMQKWINAGGIWITHTSAHDTIRQLIQMNRYPQSYEG